MTDTYLSMQEAQQRIARVNRETARTDATTITITDPERSQARRVQRGGRVVVLPPEGHGDIWNGGAR